MAWDWAPRAAVLASPPCLSVHTDLSVHRRHRLTPEQWSLYADVKFPHCCTSVLTSRSGQLASRCVCRRTSLTSQSSPARGRGRVAVSVRHVQGKALTGRRRGLYNRVLWELTTETGSDCHLSHMRVSVPGGAWHHCARFVQSRVVYSARYVGDRFFTHFVVC